MKYVYPVTHTYTYIHTVETIYIHKQLSITIMHSILCIYITSYIGLGLRV